MTTIEHRGHPRYRVHWNASIIIELGDEKIIHQGRTFDISLGGASFYTALNVFVKEPVTMLLNIPDGNSEKDWPTLEIRSRMVYTVLSANHDKFRIGLHFLSFKDGGKRILEETLCLRVPLNT